MSDPMTMPEIEDVVSSIRRLVSEHKETRITTLRDEVGKFVLTPALRVEDVPVQPAPESDATEAPSVTLSDHEDEAPAVAPAADMTDEISFIHRAPRMAAVADSAEPEELLAEAAPEVSADDTADAKTPEPVAEADTAPVLLTAELAAPVDAAPADTAPQADTATAGPVPVEWEDDAPEIDETGNWPDPAPEPAPARAQSLEDRIAELEAAVGAHADEFEPDGSESENHSPQSATILSLARSAKSRLTLRFDPEPEAASEADALDAAETDVSDKAAIAAEPAPEQDDQPEPRAVAYELDPSPLDLDDGEALLDEEALREMVAQIVRQELQGELGERITRNVRRLVRREVQRALTLRDLD